MREKQEESYDFKDIFKSTWYSDSAHDVPATRNKELL